MFEDQRSGETLGRLQKVRTDVEKLIATSINVLFTSLVGIVFVMIYAFSVHWIIAPAYFLTVPLLGILSSVLSRRIKQIQKVIVAETTALAGSTTESLRNIELVKSLGLGSQEIGRLNGTTAKILQLELKKVNGLPGNQIDLDALRAQIGFVTQDTQLFSGTIPREPAVREPGRQRRRVPRGAAQGGVRQPARPRGEGARHRDRLYYAMWRQQIGERRGAELAGAARAGR